MTQPIGNLVVRPAIASDAAAWRQMWADFVALDTEKCPQSATDFIWRNALDASHPMKLLMAVEGEERLGFLLYTTHDFSRSVRPVAYLLDFYVIDVARGRGVGKALIAHLAELGRATGWLKIYWMTQVDNVDARRLYDKFGQTSPLVRYDMQLNSYEA
ncbi:MAG: GNAT family N-acetyltransferase [Hyphomicrobiaceae bacterium]